MCIHIYIVERKSISFLFFKYSKIHYNYKLRSMIHDTKKKRKEERKKINWLLITEIGTND